MNELNELRYNIEERESMEQRRRDLNKKLYLEEVIKKEKPTFESNNMILAPVGSGKSHLIERIESRNGIHTIEASAELNIGSREYELINID